MTRRLIRFMAEVEHYDPLFQYRPGTLQKVPDALSRMAGVREEGDPADTSRFLEMEDDETLFVIKADTTRFFELEDEEAPVIVKDNTSANDTPADSTPASEPPETDTPYFEKIKRYLRYKNSVDTVEEELKIASEKYLFRDGNLYCKELGIRIILDQEEVKDLVQLVHKDLGYYGKGTTMMAVKQRS